MQLSSVWLSREMKTASADGTGESSHTSGEEEGCGHHGGGGQHSPAAKSRKFQCTLTIVFSAVLLKMSNCSVLKNMYTGKRFKSSIHFYLPRKELMCGLRLINSIP